VTGLRVFLSRLLDVVLRRRREREFGEEIESHLEFLVEEHLRRGLPLEAARAAARRDFGGIESTKDACRQQRGFSFANALDADILVGFRLLAKSGWSTSVAVTALALAIGSSLTVFTFVNAVTLRGLPVEESDRLMRIHRLDQAGGRSAISYEVLDSLRSESTSFQGLAGYFRSSTTLTDPGLAPEQIRSLYISADGFELLRVSPALGRGFVPEDEASGAPPVVILGNSVFRGRYGGDRRILGSTIGVNGIETVVIGVMPEGFQFDYFADLWQPLDLMPRLTTERREVPQLSVFGRLEDGVDLAAARLETEAIDARHRGAVERGDRLVVTPFTGTIADMPIIPALLGAAMFIVLIACANVASLLLAGASSRAREMAIRAAIGASRFRILRQLTVESVLLAILAGIVGWGVAMLGVRLFAETIGDIPKPYWVHFTMDGSVFLFFAALCLGSTLCFGLAPALHLSRASLGALKASVSFGPRRWTNGLLAVELALTLTLLTGAGLLWRSFLALYQLDLVVNTRNLSAMALRLPEEKYPAPLEWERFFRELEEQLSAISSIDSATTASTFPFAGASTRRLEREGSPETVLTVSYLTVGSSYFDTLGLATVLGRGFLPGDGEEGRKTGIVSQLLAKTVFPDENPIGRRIGLSDGSVPASWLTIVGVAPDVRQRPGTGPEPTVYLPFRADPQPFAVVLVRGAEGMDGGIAAVREEVRALDPDLPLHGITDVERLRSQSRWHNRVFAAMFGVFASVALGLSAVGLYALVTRAVSQRVQEIGVRMAFGADARQILWLVTRGIVIPLGIGLTFGLAGALAVGRLLGSFLVRTSPTDPTTLAAIAGVLLVVALLACWLPARRATRLDPMAALRFE
jgi:predicted permease